MQLSHPSGAGSRCHVTRCKAQDKRTSTVKATMPKYFRHASLLCLVAVVCAGCAQPEPPTLEAARSEVERVLKIWKDRKYIGRMSGVGAKSMDGHDIDRFLPTKNLSNHLLKSYEILGAKENGPGDYEFTVSLSTYAWGGIPAFADERDRASTETTKYLVTRGKRATWFVTDARLEALYQSIFSE